MMTDDKCLLQRQPCSSSSCKDSFASTATLVQYLLSLLCPRVQDRSSLHLCWLTTANSSLGMRCKLTKVWCRHKRPRTEVDPEAVLLKSGLDAGTAAAFLHENMLEFVDNDAMEEAAQAYSYLSHAGASTLHALNPCRRLTTCVLCLRVALVLILAEGDVTASSLHALAGGHVIGSAHHA